MGYFYFLFWLVLWRFKPVFVSVVLLSMIKPFPLLWGLLWGLYGHMESRFCHGSQATKRYNALQAVLSRFNGLGVFPYA
jgi:hypothetical protein